ncbi:sn-glycerol-1-phosphate dehydrogenase [Rhodobacteraceae bacterium HSP-20]|uniref:Sn-glycerol-1-phosphate dehydrogenase n=1 Tax=Paragemmobacter amnigenus TaxID=2852097 RepID=A0ABS6J2Q6_9RHOB|nr:sn-glycerol-1-phosphate dehydrogenase [Rhodobacter amnigenus]MBU9697807.1 sn-glycerol-1-phosphate dehydrogenase [Rhodobacter amnigenus]MBV4389034.1 sn-glycerol-1-phosphate dehydrogenase [Rhodobacter amnigenus]
MTAGLIAGAVAKSATVAEVLVGRGVLAEAGALFRRQFGEGPACIIADDNTWKAAGAAVEASLVAAGIAVRRHVLAGKPRLKPTVDLADRLRDVLAVDGSVPVAVGSGVINDVVKHAAFSLKRAYLCVGTAASMDGYTSAGAPLSDKGFKKTIQCLPARAVIGDLDVIAAAPAEMTGWGYGDLAGKVPAGGDWIIADALGIEAVDDVAWPLVQGGLRGWLGAADGVAAGEPAALEGLFAGLTLVGLAMELHGSSRPASGADHQIAHLWEMDDLKFGGERVSHGACVAVGCVMSLRLFDWLLRQDLSRLDVGAAVAAAPSLGVKIAAIHAAFGPGEIAARSVEEVRAKHVDAAVLRARLERLRDGWPVLAERLRAQVVAPEVMVDMLHRAGAPAEAAEIGVGRDYLRRTTLNARFLRSRYTVLDLLDECGMLEAAVEASLPPMQRKEGRG